MKTLAAALFIWCAVLGTSTAVALDPTEALSELAHHKWTVEEGSPPNISRVVQTRDGLLWLASESGLFQFDGVRFQRMSLSDGSQPITGAVSGIDTISNDLWVGMRLGGVFLLHEGTLTHYGLAEGLPSGSVVRIVARQDGTVWAQTSAGLYLLSGKRWKRVGVDWNYHATTGNALYLDKAGTMWAGSYQGISYLPRASHAFVAAAFSGVNSYIDEGPGGVAYLFDFDTGIRALSGTAGGITGKDMGGDTGKIGPGRFDTDGGLWCVVAMRGVMRLIRVPSAAERISRSEPIHPRDAQVLKSTQPLSGIPNFLYEDRERNLWIGTTGGLDQFRSNKLHAALDSVSVPAIAVDHQGHMWAAMSHKIVSFYSLPDSPANSAFVTPYSDPVSSLIVEHDGSVVIGQDGGHLGRVSAGQYFAISVPGRSPDIQGLAEDATGALWIASVGGGLYRQDGPGWKINGGLPELPSAVPISLENDTERRLWIGYPDDQLFLIDTALQVRRFDRSSGLLVGAVLAVFVNGTHVWAAGTEGVSLMQGQMFVTLRNNKGSSFVNVSGIVEDSLGGLWLNGGDGITHISAEEISAFIKDRGHHLSTSGLNFEDGTRLSTPLFRRLPTALQDGLGRVWFLTTGGAYWIDPKNISSNSLPPSVIVQSVIANGHSYAENNREIRLLALTTSFEIDYTATSLTMPSRVRFRYKLEGVDQNWQEAGNRRQSFYTNVSPGEHLFRVTAANEDGLWNETGTSALLVIPPVFYQTRLFHLLTVASGLLILWQLYLARVRQIRLQLQARLGERLDERERIARELHDTLLQSAQGLILFVQGLAARIDRPRSIRREVEVALDHADQLLNESRDRVNDLRTAGLDSDVEKAIAQFGTEFFKDKSVHLTLSSDGQRRRIAPAVADDILRICREALTNALLHANATIVTVGFDYGSSHFRLRVKDNGRGIEAGVRESGFKPRHFGLPGMRERARRLRGTLTITTSDGAGTEVELRVPASMAYFEAPKGHSPFYNWIRRAVLRMVSARY